MMKKLLKQTAFYSVLVGVSAIVSPIAVSAKDVKNINLYGIDTGLIVTNKPAFTEAEVIAVVASIAAGAILVANARVIKRLLNK